MVMKRPISANISLSLEAAIPEDIVDNESAFLCMPSKKKSYAKTKSTWQKDRNWISLPDIRFLQRRDNFVNEFKLSDN